MCGLQQSRSRQPKRFLVWPHGLLPPTHSVPASRSVPTGADFATAAGANGVSAGRAYSSAPSETYGKSMATVACARFIRNTVRTQSGPRIKLSRNGRPSHRYSGLWFLNHRSERVQNLLQNHLHPSRLVQLKSNSFVHGWTSI